jgi:Domain of unknown function (DUF4862)
MTASPSGTRGYIVGAYASSPTAAGWDPALEAEYFEALAGDPRVAAFETPWNGSLHAHDVGWFLDHFPARLTAVVTGVARAYLTTAKDPQYGLASRDAEGRARGLADAAAIRDDVHRLNERQGRQLVRAVELQTAPKATEGSAAALAASLTEIGDWDWQGAQLVIEHCDALVPGQTPQKGFLALTDEITAIQQSGTAVGIALNWGRSAIEFRDPDRVVEHVAQANDADVLRGIIVSGASDQEGYFNQPWVDAHHRFQHSAQHPLGDPISLLTDERIRAVVAAAGDDVWLGVKLGWPVQEPAPIDVRVRMIRDALDSLDRARGIA